MLEEKIKINQVSSRMDQEKKKGNLLNKVPNIYKGDKSDGLCTKSKQAFLK